MNCLTSGGLFACTAIPPSSVNPFWDALTPTVTLEPPCFTRTTALAQQLPLLNGLPSTTRPRNNRPLPHQEPSSPLTLPSPSPLLPLSSDSSDSEGNAYIHKKRAYTHKKHHHTMSTLATVEPTSAKAPVLTEGDISPNVVVSTSITALNPALMVSPPVKTTKRLLSHLHYPPRKLKL